MHDGVVWFVQKKELINNNDNPKQTNTNGQWKGKKRKKVG